jgi:hypothetical protein
VSRPWEIPGDAWLDARWNVALDLASSIPVSPAKVAAAWREFGADRTLARLRKLAAGGDEAAREGAA